MMSHARSTTSRTPEGRLALWAASLAACAFVGSIASPALAGPDSAAPPPPADQSARDTEPLVAQPINISPAGSVTNAPPARTPAMNVLDKLGLAAPLDNLGLRFYGHVEGSYTANFDNPARNLNAGRVFDVENEDITLNQLTLNLDRLVTVSDKNWDIGGRMEWMWGGDARFIHGNGLFSYYDNNTSANGLTSPDNQWDLTQAYVDVAVPIGNGVRVRAGKFTYFKSIDPNTSVFYSHSFTFGAALPFTLTGVYGTYQLNDQLTFDGGVSRGWDQALDDSNGAVDVFGRIKYNITRQTSIEAKFICGPEQDNDNSHWRNAVDVTLSHQIGDNTLLFVDAIYANQAGASFVSFSNGIPAAHNDSEAYWYGISGYAIQRINEYVSLAGRIEWFRDEEGYTTSVAQNLYEATVGVTITPFPNDQYGQYFKVRPELRADYSSRAFFDGFSKHEQFTFGIDAIYNF